MAKYSQRKVGLRKVSRKVRPVAEPPAPVPAPAPLEWDLASVPDTRPGDAGPQDETAPPPEGDKAEAPVNEITVKGEYGPPKSDPLERVNEESYRLTQAVDRALVEPVADAYQHVPEPMRDGLGNVVRNLGEPSNALNFLLQGKVGKAFETLPVFDFWPVRYATSYEFVPGPACPQPLPPDDPGFRACYRPVGDFPEVDLGLKSVTTRIFTAFGAGLAPIL